jgi:calcineurin-like phosphoesterase family protein
MDAEIIRRFNSVVSSDDVTYHLGDFTFRKKNEADDYLNRLNGKHIFIRGNHDYWAEKDNLPYIIEKKFGESYLVLCHYPLLSWPRSAHNSIQLFGHEHGVLKGIDKNQLDVGVDTNDFYPYSLEDIRKKLKL